MRKVGRIWPKRKQKPISMKKASLRYQHHVRLIELGLACSIVYQFPKFLSTEKLIVGF
jgi:hypothetical protein